MEDNSRYLCAETAEDRKRFVAAVIKNKVGNIQFYRFARLTTSSLVHQYPNGGIQTPIMPVRTVPLGIDPRNRGVSVLVSQQQCTAIQYNLFFLSFTSYI